MIITRSILKEDASSKLNEIKSNCHEIYDRIIFSKRSQTAANRGHEINSYPKPCINVIEIYISECRKSKAEECIKYN